MAVDVIGREQELASIEAFLDSVREGPRALALSGEPGIGKTVLWEVGVREAERRFPHVLSHRSAEAEAMLAFAGLFDLLAPVLDEVAPSLAPPRRRALEVALLLVEPGSEASDPRAIGLAVLNALQLLAEQGEVMIALDDLQWLDSSSAAALQIALRRLREEPVGLLATVRGRHDAAHSHGLGRVFPEDRSRSLAVGPLGLGMLHHLLRDRFALELTRPELARVQEASEGNPFLALELGRELVRTGTRPKAGTALPVPASLHELLDGRLARLPPETLDVLVFGAALTRPTVELVTTAYGSEGDVVEALDAAVREGVVELDDSRLWFAHPLLASICYEQAPVSKRRAVHLALAEAVDDIEERAHHLALAADGPDATIATGLDEAAERAAARGASAAAAELSELAARLTPPEDAGSSRERRFRAVRSHRLSGDLERAVSILNELLAEVSAGPERADVLFALASTQRADPATPIRLCSEALADAEGDDARLARILACRSWNRLLQTDVDGALVDGRLAFEYAERVDDPELLVAVIANLGRAELWAADVTPGLLEQGDEIERRLRIAPDWFDSASGVLARRLLHLGEHERVRELAGELDAHAAARGDEITPMRLGWIRGTLEWLAGRWQLAAEQASAGWELAEQTQSQDGRAWLGRIKTLIAVDLGLVDEARASAEEGLALARGMSDEFFVVLSSGLLGRLELALGNIKAAKDHLGDGPARLIAWGLKDPTLTIWADAIESLIAGDDPERARSYLEHYEAGAAQLGSPWAIAAAARCRGLLAAREGDLELAFGAFERSLAELGNVTFPLERGRTLLGLGVVRRQGQQRTAARAALEQALAIFEELGARLWAEKARTELRRISGRRPADDELTESEFRVASLAAEGRSNKEIAAELFMGVSTVEAHLSRVYRKLGIRSRASLADRLRAVADDGARAAAEPAQS